MKGFWAIYKRELFALFVTPLAWVLITAFLVVQGIHFAILVTQFAGPADLTEGGQLVRQGAGSEEGIRGVGHGPQPRTQLQPQPRTPDGAAARNAAKRRTVSA